MQLKNKYYNLCTDVQVSINNNQPDHYLDVSWKKDVHHARLVADMQTRIFHIYGTKEDGDGKLHCVSNSPFWNLWSNAL